MATNLHFIKNITSNNEVSTLELTDIFSADYDVYTLVCRNIDIKTGGNYPYVMWRYLKASDGSVDSTSNYDYSNAPLALIGTHGTWRNQNQTTFTHQYFDTNEKTSGGFVINIYRPFDSSTYTNTTSQSASYYNGGRYQCGFKGASTHKVAQSNSGLKLETGTVNAEFNIYGVKG